MKEREKPELGSCWVKSEQNPESGRLEFDCELDEWEMEKE